MVPMVQLALFRCELIMNDPTYAYDCDLVSLHVYINVRSLSTGNGNPRMAPALDPVAAADH